MQQPDEDNLRERSPAAATPQQHNAENGDEQDEVEERSTAKKSSAHTSKRTNTAANRNKKSNNNWNPVAELNRLIAEFGSSDKTRVELRPVVDSNCWGDPSKALFRGASEGDLSLVRAALCSGMNTDAFFRGQTPLMFASENGHTAVCLLLIANGADVNKTDKYNRTALHYACRNKHVGCAAALMDGGAKNDIECDLGGETPGDLARHTGNRDLVRYVNFYDQNVAEIRSSALKAAVSELRDVEGLALTAVHPVIEQRVNEATAKDEAAGAAAEQREDEEEEEL